MTRAMKRLYLTFAQGRMLWGSLRFNPPSRFLDEIPEDFYTWSSFKKGASSAKKITKKKKNSDFDCSDEFSQVNDFEGEGEVTYISSTPKIEFTYPVGTQVKHKLYGEGKILEADGIGKEEKVVILFRDGTRKKFLVKFAPLVKV
jgi:DNA helicase-2/ATP-dependent DNA helicase PcrA